VPSVTPCQSHPVSNPATHIQLLALRPMLGHTSAKFILDTYADLFDDDLDTVAVRLHARIHGRVCSKCAHGVLKGLFSQHKKGLYLRFLAGSYGGGGGI
jgi:hypothetical protein